MPVLAVPKVKNKCSIRQNKFQPAIPIAFFAQESGNRVHAPIHLKGSAISGLKWMQSVKQQTGLLTATEVANASHVEECLKHGIDILWIGARTTVNPFSVQEIADALKGVDIPVFVKNPIYPDLQLWAGALERVNNVGIKKIAAIHRGFHSYDNGPFRNSPKWELAIELKTACPELPVICDPSHIEELPNSSLILPKKQWIWTWTG